MQCVSPVLTLKGFKKCWISTAGDETDDNMFWNGNVSCKCEEWRHCLWRWRQWLWLINVCRISHALCLKCMKLIVKYFFLAYSLYLGVILHLDKYIFPWQTCFFGGCLRLESFCIRVNIVFIRTQICFEEQARITCLKDSGTLVFCIFVVWGEGLQKGKYQYCACVYFSYFKISIYLILRVPKFVCISTVPHIYSIKYVQIELLCFVDCSHYN